jgi:hypothetical protein
MTFSHPTPYPTTVEAHADDTHARRIRHDSFSAPPPQRTQLKRTQTTCEEETGLHNSSGYRLRPTLPSRTLDRGVYDDDKELILQVGEAVGDCWPLSVLGGEELRVGMERGAIAPLSAPPASVGLLLGRERCPMMSPVRVRGSGLGVCGGVSTYRGEGPPGWQRGVC